MRNVIWIIWATIVIVLAGVQFSSASEPVRQSTVVYPSSYSNASYGHMTPQQIRQMPLLARPNRPGHFYGNTVRRIYYRRHGYSYRGR